MKKLILFLLLAAPVFGQVTVAPFTNSRVVFLNASGAPCAACQLDTFSAGTTTPLATYSDSAGSTPNSNPIILGSDGSAVIYMTTASYKFRLRGSVASGGATLWTQDNVSWVNLANTVTSLISNGTLQVIPSTAATSGANQSGPNTQFCGNFWNGSASAADCWTWADVLGTGANPTSTLTLTHSGSSGTASVSWPNALFDLGSLGNLRFSSDTNVSRIGAGIVGFGTGAQGNAGATTRQAIVQVGGSDTGLSRDSAGVIDVGNGTQGDKSGTVNATAANVTGAVTVGTINKVTITQPASSATLTIANGKTLTANNSLTFAGTDGTTQNMPASGNVVGTTDSQTLTNKILTSPTINGTFTPGTAMAKGSATNCAIGAGVGSACNTSITWSNTLPNTTYTVTCELDNPNTPSTLGATSSKTTTSINVTTINMTAGAALTASGTVRCIAWSI